MSIWQKIYRAVNHPELIGPYLHRRYHYLQYKLGIGYQAPGPTDVKLYINNACNAHCLICDIGLRNRDSVFYQQLVQTEAETLSLDACHRILHEVAPSQPLITLGGVEPLLHPQILEMVELIKGHHMPIVMSTNGILLSKFAKGLAELGTDTIIVSLDGPEEINDRIRGRGIYHLALDGLAKLNAARNASGIPIRIGAGFCINNLNCHCLADFAASLLEAKTVDFISFTHLYYVTEEASEAHNQRYAHIGRATPMNIAGVDPRRVDVDILWEQMSKVSGTFDASRVFFTSRIKNLDALRAYYREPAKPVSRKNCRLPWTQTTILPDGEVIIQNRCFLYKAGNILKKPFEEIWNGERYQDFRRELRKNGPFPVCARCPGILAGI